MEQAEVDSSLFTCAPRVRDRGCYMECGAVYLWERPGGC